MRDERTARSTGHGAHGPFGFGHGPGRPGGPLAGLMGPKVRAKDTRATLRRLWGYLGRQRSRLVLALGLVLLTSVAGLVGPLLIGAGIDAMAQGTGRVDFHRLGLVAVAMAALYLANAVAAWFQNYAVVAVSQQTVHDLRRDLFTKLQRLPLRFFDTRTHGEVMSRLANDVENINNTLAQSTIQVFSSLITLVGSLAAMLALNPLLTLVCLVTVPLGMGLTGQIARRTRAHFLAQQQALGELNGYIEEMVTGLKVVKAFGREEAVVAQFGTINARLQRAAIRAQVFSGIIPPLMNCVNNLSFALVAAAGGWLALKGSVSLGVVASFLNYSRQFARPINELANQLNMVQSALAGAERAFEVLDEPEEPADAPGALQLTSVRGEVRFEHVTFGYVPGVPVLKDVSLYARPGQTIALVGPTGAGKTTVINLLTRFYDIWEGAITIDGHDLRTLKRESLRRALAIVLQDTYLFAGTVRENIRYGRLDATDEEVEEAARLAYADTFIRRLPQGYDTVLTAEGANLSQGQRQLLTIARAILANPAILILDEATSSVDTRTEMHIQEAMRSLRRGRTSFVIAHRLSTIQEADEILVIDGGRIVERGTHAELLARRGFYHRLYTSQFQQQAAMEEATA